MIKENFNNNDKDSKINKEIFEKDMEEYMQSHRKLSHIKKGDIDPSLSNIDELYGYASKLSSINKERHRNILLFLAILGTALALSFLIYDEAEFHFCIFICIFLIIILISVLNQSRNLKCHDKYLEYRLLAETLRVQFFLSMAGIEVQATELLPWFIKNGIGWIEEVIVAPVPLPKSEANRKAIIEFWIDDQIKYHKSKIEIREKRLETFTRIPNRLLRITIVTFIITLFFEVLMLFNPTGEINNVAFAWILNGFQHVGMMINYNQVDMIRALLKIIIGTMAAGTLFFGSYYGKMSISEVVDDHQKMIDLYNDTRYEMENGITDELIINLVRQFLIENATWYAYQKQNKADFVI